jgi:hypothetical protein
VESVHTADRHVGECDVGARGRAFRFHVNNFAELCAQWLRTVRSFMACEASPFFTMRQTFQDPCDPKEVGTARLSWRSSWTSRGLATRKRVEGAASHRLLDLSNRELIADKPRHPRSHRWGARRVSLGLVA